MSDLPPNYRQLSYALGDEQGYDDEDKQIAWLQRRWHEAQSDPAIDTAQKRLARAAGHKTVRCICGCRQEFTAIVRAV